MKDIGETLIWSLRRVRVRLRGVVALSLAFRVLNFILLTPLAAFMLRRCLSRWGRASVGNFEIAVFLLSPAGLVALLGVGTVLLASLYFELAGSIRLLADSRLNWWQSLLGSTRMFHRLLRMGLRQTLVYLLMAIPFLAGISLVYWLFWSGRDLNGLIILKPAEFWMGAALAGTLGACYGALSLRQALLWLYAVPILLFEPEVGVIEALRLSTQRSRGRLGHLAGAIGVWAVAQGIVAMAVLGLLRIASHWLLHLTGSSLTLAVLVSGTVLAVNAAVAIAVNMFGTVTLAGLILSLYREVVEPRVLDMVSSVQFVHAGSVLLGRLLGPALLASAALAMAGSLEAVRHLKLEDRLEITAHRAGAAHAPENTVAALQRSIDDGADWAEIDVQLTADAALVVMHDIDLARVGGGARRVDQATLAEIKGLDASLLFEPEFTAVRIPTLEEILIAAGDRIRLNVELKPHSKEDGDALTKRVIEAIRKLGMVNRCRLCSQSYESLQLAQEIEPRLEVGYIVATTLGDPAQLDVNFLMVQTKLATRQLVERARLRGIGVHAWTVNDPILIAPLLDSGIANVITDDPWLMRSRLEEIRALSPVNRLLLRVRHALAD